MTLTPEYLLGAVTAGLALDTLLRQRQEPKMANMTRSHVRLVEPPYDWADHE